MPNANPAADRSGMAASRAVRAKAKVYLVGGGIASMAAAAFLIRDGDIPGHNITILEELDRLGGSLDGAGSPDSGYVLRGGRMFESKYVCTFELFSAIPTLDGSRTVTQEIVDWNDTMKTSSKSRLVRDGQRQTAPEFGLSEKDILALEGLALEPEIDAGPHQHCGSFRSRVLQVQFLVHVVYDLCVSALAQRDRVQTLSGALCAHGFRLRSP